MSADPRYEVKCWRRRYGDQWVVFRVADGEQMTSGSVTHCLQWVKVWGPMRAPLVGQTPRIY